MDVSESLGRMTLLVIIAFFCITLITVPTAAQQVGNQTEQTPEPQEQYGTLYDLTIHSVEFTDRDGGATGKITVSWHGETPTQVTITQLPQNSNGVMFSSQRIYPGEKTELRVDLISTSDPAIIYTPQSIENERALRLDDDSGYLIPGPWSSTDAQIAGLAGLIGGLGLTTIFAYKRLRMKTNDAERVL